MSTQLNSRSADLQSSRKLRGSGLRGWKLPVLLGLGLAVAGFIICTFITHWYRTTTTIYFVSQGNADPSGLIGQFIGKGKGSGLLSKLGGGGGGGGDASGSVALLGGMFSQPEIGSGPETAIAVLDSDRLHKAVSAECGLAHKWNMKEKDVMKRLDEKATYGVDKNGLLALEVDDPDPNLTVTIANSYLKNLQLIDKELSTGFSRKNRQFLERELAATRARVETQEDKLVALQSKKGRPVMSTDASEKLVEAYLDLEKQRAESHIQLAAAENEIKWATHAANLTIENGLDLPLDIPIGQGHRTQVRDLEARFNYAKETLGPDNPEYNSLKLQLDTARSQLQDEVKREAMALKEGISPDVATLYATRIGLQAETDGLDDASKRMQRVLAEMPSMQMQMLQLQGDLRIDADLMAMLATETEKAKIAEERDSATFIVFDKPELPEEPYMPRRGLVTLISFVAGLLIGSAWLVTASVARTLPAPSSDAADSE